MFSRLAAIKINRKRSVSLAGKFGCLFFHPIIETPPFVNHDDGWKGTVAGRCVEDALHSLVAALIRNSFAVGGEGDGSERYNREN